MEETASAKAAPTGHTETISEKQDKHIEQTLTNEVHGFEVDGANLRKGYYFSPFFIGTFFAIGLALICGTAAFGLAAPILSVINNDLGPDDRYTWISLVYNAVLAVCLSPVGRLSDIFGRRWFFIGGALIAMVGSVVCATAKDIPTMVRVLNVIHRLSDVLTGIRSAEMSFLLLPRKSHSPKILNVD